MIGSQELLYFIQEENEEEVTKCLDQMSTAEINSADENGMVRVALLCNVKGALHWAARTGNREISKLLLKVKGIKVNNQDSLGWTPLHVCLLFTNF